ncbi:MAG: urease accessory protein UreD [Actinomycetota bacterium]|nr:urease accessory protein UreD [Actinomycetota bacterium]
MISRTAVRVEAGGVLDHLYCTPPLTLRRIAGDRDSCALCLVGTAAGPLPGDDLHLSLRLGSRARASLSAAGASIAQGGGAPMPSRLSVSAALGPGAQLEADPGAVVVCSGARVDLSVSIQLADDAAIQWRELVVLGRTGEAAGAVTLRWEVQRGGSPLLRQFVDLRDPRFAAWPGLVAGARVMASELISAPDVQARTLVRSRTCVAAQLDAHSMLLTVLGDDAAQVGAEVAALRESVLECTG